MRRLRQSVLFTRYVLGLLPHLLTRGLEPIERYTSEFLQRFPEAHDVRLALGDFYRRGKRYSVARPCYEAAVASQGLDASVAAALVEVYYFLKEYEKVREIAPAAEERVRASRDLPSYVGAALAQLGAPKEALGYLESARRLGADGATLRENLGWCQFELGHYEEAAREYEAVLPFDASSQTARDRAAEAHLRLSEVALKAAHRDVAFRHLTRGMDLRPSDDILARIAEQLRSLGERFAPPWPKVN